MQFRAHFKRNLLYHTEKNSNTNMQRKYTQFKQFRGNDKIYFVCDIFIHRPHEFLCGGDAIKKRKRQNYLRFPCTAELVSVHLYFVGTYVIK